MAAKEAILGGALVVKWRKREARVVAEVERLHHD